MNRLLVLLLATATVGVVAARGPCNNPQWQTLVGKNSVGGVRLTNVTSRAACQNFCALNSSTCVAVDIEQVGFPPGCWLHLSADDLLPTNVYDQRTTNQYRLADCSNVSTAATCGQSTWEVYPNQISIYATQYVGPRTIQQCLDYCINNSKCLAVDVDVNRVPLGCWPHFDSNDLIADNVYPQPGTNQYRLVQRCPVLSATVCYNPEWSVSDRSAYGALQYFEPTSVQECLDYCGQKIAGCVAADIDMSQTPPACWLHDDILDLAEDNLYKQNNVTQYRLVTKCASSPITVPQSTAATTTTTVTTTVTTTQGPVCPVGRWQLFADQTALGADKYVGPRTIQQCLDYCNRNPSCVAVDIDVNSVPLGCWPHFDIAQMDPDNIYSQPGTFLYKLVSRCTNPPPASGCYNPDWSVLYNTSSVGADEYKGPKSVQECLDYCGQSAAGCVAVDVSLDENGAITCWPHLNSSALMPSNVYPQSGVNQYRLLTKCATYPVGESPPTTTTPAPTTTLGPICPVGRWKLLANQQAVGANQYIGPRTIEQCLAYCNNRTDCVAIDIDMNAVPIGCWPHFSTDDLINIYDGVGTYHYQILERCRNSTVVSECYNPDWSVRKSQSSINGVPYSDATTDLTVQQCLDVCGKSKTGCVAVDVEQLQSSLKCWLHFNSTDLVTLYPQQNVTQYRLVTKCADYPVGASPPVPSTTTVATTTTLGPICPHGRWQKFPNQIADGADQYVGPRTVAQCLDYCNNRTDCVAVDVDVNAVPVGCWPHFSSAALDPRNIYTQSGTVQYRLVDRCTTPTIASGCYNPEWTTLVNQSASGATQYVGPTSVQECLDYCGQTAVGCVAVDVDLNQNPPTCWPYFDRSLLGSENMYDRPLVNQYRMVTKCASLPITTTTTTTLAPIGTLTVDVSPAYGPQVGGTSVKITCQTFNMLNIAYVVFGDSVAPVQSSTQTSVVVLSPQSDAAAKSAIFLVTNDRRTISIGPQFEYRLNPVITDIKPLSHLINGGTLVTISGQNLDSVAHPMIELIVATFTSPQDYFQTAMFELCHKPADRSLIGKQMVCQMPSVVIPPDVQSKLELQDGMLSGNLGGGRGGVASAVEDDGRTVVVNAGFILDGVTTYRNITSTLPNILMDFYVQPAVYCSQGADDSVAYVPSSDSVAFVEGYGLLRGSRAADYVVTVGGKNCDIVDVFNTILSFSPPAVQPNRTRSDANCQNDGVTLAITAGYATYRCCIVYNSNSPTALKSNVSLILGLVLGLGIPFLILLILIVICCICCTRKSCCHKDGECGREKKNPVGPIINPNYEHSTLSAVPSTSSSTAPIEAARPPSPVQSEANFYWAPEKPGGSARIKPTFNVVDREAETS